MEDDACNSQIRNEAKDKDYYDGIKRTLSVEAFKEVMLVDYNGMNLYRNAFFVLKDVCLFGAGGNRYLECGFVIIVPGSVGEIVSEPGYRRGFQNATFKQLGTGVRVVIVDISCEIGVARVVHDDFRVTVAV